VRRSVLVLSAVALLLPSVMLLGETTAASSAVADGRGKSKLSAEVSAVSAEDDGDGELRSRSPPGGGGEGSEAMVAEREWKK